MSTATLMASLGQTRVAEILGPYESLLDEKQESEHEALVLMNAGVALSSATSLANCQRRRDVDRRLGIYASLALEAALRGGGGVSGRRGVLAMWLGIGAIGVLFLLLPWPWNIGLMLVFWASLVGWFIREGTRRWRR